jgi:hypothetical protein
VFSLGAVLTFAATGRGPFDAPTDLAIMRRTGWSSGTERG